MAASKKVVYLDSFRPSFKKEMIEYIREYYKETLGDDLKLLETAEGLDTLAAKMRKLNKGFTKGSV